MAKNKRMYGCTECGATFPKWTGQCSECRAWNTLTETMIESGGATAPTEPSAVDFARLSGVHVQVLGQVVYVADDPVGSYHCTQKNGG